MTTRHPKVDVVTVGAGWTSAILGSKLCPAGKEVVALEQGAKRWTYPDFAHDHDSLRYSVRYAMMVDLARETWTWRPRPGDPALPMRQYGSFNPGEGLGGSAIHWSGQLWRFMESDFRHRSYIVDRYGAGRLPAGSTIRDWPVVYGDLEPYYDAFERDIGASGIAGNLRGRIQPGGNPFEAPRSRPYPHPPLATNRFADMFAEASTALGLHPFPQPAGILSQAWTDPFGNHRSGCLYCGFCTRFGCEVDAKASPQNTHLPVALRTGRYHVRLGAKVTRIETDAGGRATGVTYVDHTGQVHFQPADLVILSAFTLENNRLLLLSKSAAHPRGIGNAHGMVGRNYTYQIYPAPITGLFSGTKLNMYMGNTCTISIVYDYNGDNFDHSDLDFVGGMQLYSEPCEREALNSVTQLTTEDGKSWGAAWKKQLARDWDSYASIVTEGESIPYSDQFLDLDPHYTDRYGNPLLRITFDWHDNEKRMWRYIAERAREIMRAMGPSRVVEYVPEMPDYNIHDYQSTHPTGGCTMGTGPGDSVTTSYGQVWDTPNVFVTGAALFPQNPGANPTGTVGALAYRTAEAMLDRYFDNPGELLDT